MAKAEFNEKTLLISKLYLYLKKKLVKFIIWSIVLFAVENLTLRRGD